MFGLPCTEQTPSLLLVKPATKAAVNPFLVDEYNETILHRIGKYTKVIMSNAFNMFERVTSTIFVTSE